MMEDIFDQLASESIKKREKLLSSIGDKINKRINTLVLEKEKIRERDSAKESKKANEEMLALLKSETLKTQSKLSEDLSLLIKNSISKLKPTERIVERIVQPKIIKETVISPTKTETIIKEVPAKNKYAELKQIEELKKEIELLKKSIRRDPDIQVIGNMLPNYSGAQGKVLSTDGSQLKWIEAASSAASNPTITEVSEDYTATADDSFILVSAENGDVTIDLPSGVQGKQYSIKKIDSSDFVVTIQPNGVEAIDGDSTAQIAFENTTVSIVSDGENWWIV